MNSQIVPLQPKPKDLASFKGRIVPKFLVEKYLGMEQDIVEFLQAYYYHQQNPDLSKLQTPKDLARADANARMSALAQAAQLEQSFEEAKIIQLHEADKTGWYANTDSIHNLSEMIEVTLEKQIEKDPSGGTRYELEHLLRVLNQIETMALTEAAQQGDTSDERSEQIAKAVTGMIANPKARRKMRESAKVVDKILQSDAPDEVKWDKVTDVFRDVADPDTTYLDFLNKNKGRMVGLGKEVIEPAEANIFLFSGKEMIVIESREEDMTRAIESACHGLTTEFGVSDPVRLLSDLSDALYSKGKYNYYQVEDGNLVERSSGVKLPTSEHFMELALRETSISARYINRLARYQSVFVDVYQLFKSYVPIAPKDMLHKVFGEVDEKAIMSSLTSLYSAPEDLDILLPGLACEVGLAVDVGVITIGIIVRKEVKLESIPSGSEVQT